MSKFKRAVFDKFENAFKLKRGSADDIDKLLLKYGEPALVFSPDKKSVQLWIGTGENGGKGKICINTSSSLSLFGDDDVEPIEVDGGEFGDSGGVLFDGGKF